MFCGVILSPRSAGRRRGGGGSSSRFVRPASPSLNRSPAANVKAFGPGAPLKAVPVTVGVPSRVMERCVTNQIDWLRKRRDWPGLQSIAAMDCRRQREGQTTAERRYFISRLPARTAQRIAQAVRKHWGVENELHWSLDVCFGEDDSRVRIGYAAENLSRIRRLALMLLEQEKTAKIWIKAKRLKAGWDEKYLLKVQRV